MLPRFKDYTQAEVHKAAVSFICDWRSASGLDAVNEVWTEAILDLFANAAGDGVLVDGRPSRRLENLRGKPPVAIPAHLAQLAGSPRRTRGEFLFDLTHSTYPAYNGAAYWSADYWERALEAMPIG